MTIPPPRPRLICLCADWCHLCKTYRPLFAEVAERLRAQWPDLATRWIDIEDEAELVGDLEVETFPTLLVLRGAQVLFHGALEPQPEVLERVARAALGAASPAATESNPDAAALAARIAASATPKHRG